MANETMTFKEAYDILQSHAETLRNQTEPNIDDLLSIVEESVSAYRVCKERIDAVEKALEKALTDVGPEAVRSSGDEGVSGEATPARSPRTARRSNSDAPTAHRQSSRFDDMDDDVPF